MQTTRDALSFNETNNTSLDGKTFRLFSTLIPSHGKNLITVIDLNICGEQKPQKVKTMKHVRTLFYSCYLDGFVRVTSNIKPQEPFSENGSLPQI
jgi:hypothetical protein